MTIRAVVFDWGGTLTPWHTVDLAEQWRAFARAYGGDEVLADRILAAEQTAWARTRGDGGSARLAEILAEAGVATGKDAEVFDTAARIAEELEAAGVRVLYDDRPKVSPGVKFKDAELVGVPTILVVGKGLATGTVELKDRRTGEREELPVDGAVARLLEVVRG